MKTNDEGINRRNIPVKFMNYIAQKHGYGAFEDVKNKRHFRRISDEIKQRFTSTISSFRLAYGDRFTWYKEANETQFDFVKRVDQAIKDINLSDLKSETVKQVATELLEQEKLRNDRKLVNPAYNYSTPIFDLKSMGKPVGDLDEVVKQWRQTHRKIIDFFKEILIDRVIVAEIHDEIVTESVVSFAGRFGKSMLKKSFPKGGIISERGPERVCLISGTTIPMPKDLKIETNQQWSTQELKDFLSKPNQPRKAYSEKHAYATESELKSPVYAPDNWPATAPQYNSAEGWEFEKATKLRNLKSMLTIEWLEKQQTEKHASIAKRLREILAA